MLSLHTRAAEVEAMQTMAKVMATSQQMGGGAAGGTGEPPAPDISEIS